MFSFLQSLGLYKFLYLKFDFGDQFKLNLSCIGEGHRLMGPGLPCLDYQLKLIVFPWQQIENSSCWIYVVYLHGKLNNIHQIKQLGY